ncbi:E3 ubiquitin-protein ligase DCST1-like isoform X3 [Bolinopsis microptera]
MLPVLFSGLGRSLVRSLIISLIVSGPLQNIGDNAILLAKSIECSAKLTIDQANETTEATVAALHEQMESISRATRSINENSRKVEEFADKEMVKVLETEDKKGHLSPDMMLKRGARQCHLNTDRPRKKCEIGINVDLDKCEQIKTSDDGCMNYNDQNLDKDNAVHTQGIKNSVSKFGEQYKDPKIQLSSESNIKVDNTLITTGFKKLMNELNTVGGFITMAINLVSLVLLTMVLAGAITHQVKYLTGLSYLNNVVTTQLLKLDACLPSHHRTFPLPVYMKTFVRDGSQKCLSRDELKPAVIASLKHLLFSLLFLAIVFLDSQVYGTMEDISDTGYIVYEVYIKTGVLLQSDGGSWTKGMVDGIPQVNTLNHLSFTQDNNNCLPDGSPPDQQRALCICVFILLIVLLNFFQIYSQRSVRRICAWFYPDRENLRVQFLYRFLKQRRMDCFKILVEDKRGCLPKQSMLRRYFPRLIKHSCVVCGDCGIHSSCLFCFGHGYEIKYCLECWSDTDKKCPYCKTTQKLAGYSGVAVEDSSSDSDSDNDDGRYTSPVYQIHSEEEGDEVKQTYAYSYSSYKKIIESFADSSSDDNDDDDIMDLLNGIQRGPTSPDETSLSVGNETGTSSFSRSQSIVITRAPLSQSDSVGTTRDFLPRSDFKKAGKTSSRRFKAHGGEINSASVSESIREAAFSLSQPDSSEAARNSLSQPDSNEAARNSLSQPDSNEAARNSLSQPDSNEAARNSLSQSDSIEAARNSLS